MMKIYEPVIDEKTGNIKIETELTPEEIKQLLAGAIMMLLAQGVAPKSLAHHFMPPQEEEENPLAPAPQEATKEEEKIVAAESPPADIKTLEELTDEEQKTFLNAVDPRYLPRA